MALAFVFFSCGSDEGNPFENDLYGTWTFDKFEYEIKIGDMDIIQFLQTTYGYSEAQAEEFRDLFISEEFWLDTPEDMAGTVSFNTDYTYVASFSDEDEIEEGEWSLSADGKILTLQQSENPDDSSDELEISSLSADMLVLTIDTEEMEGEFNDDGEATEMTLKVNMVFKK